MYYQIPTSIYDHHSHHHPHHTYPHRYTIHNHCIVSTSIWPVMDSILSSKFWAVATSYLFSDSSMSLARLRVPPAEMKVWAEAIRIEPMSKMAKIVSIMFSLS